MASAVKAHFTENITCACLSVENALIFQDVGKPGKAQLIRIEVDFDFKRFVTE